MPYTAYTSRMGRHPDESRGGNSWNTFTTVQPSSEIIIFTIMSKNPRGQFAQSPCRIYTAPLG